MIHQWIGTGIALALFIGGLLATVWRVSWIVSQALATMKQEFNALLTLKDAEFDVKIGRIYQRFDEYKDSIESNFIRKEMCTVVHGSNSACLAEIIKKVDSLEKKVDSLLMRKE